MKKLIAFLSFLIVFKASDAQINPYQRISAQYEYNKGKYTSALILPYDTTRVYTVQDTGNIVRIQNRLFVLRLINNQLKFDTIAGGGGILSPLKYKNLVTIINDTAQLVNAPSANPYPGRPSAYGYGGNNSPGMFPVNVDVSKTITELRTKAATAVTGMVYEFAPGNGSIARFYLDTTDVTSLDDAVMTIRSGTKILKRFYEFVDPWDFGARPNDGLSDSAAIQQAIVFAVYNLKIPVVRFVHGGNYHTQNNVIKKDADADGQLDFVTLVIEGNAPTIGAGLTATVQIYPTDPKGLGFALEKGRSCIFRNLGFQGLGLDVPDMKTLIERTDNDWTVNGYLANGRYASYTAVGIDVFHANVPANQRYINLAGQYTDASQRATSGVRFEGCIFRGFIDAISISPNGTTQNCDNIQAISCWNLSNKIFWNSGQTQARGNLIFDLYSVGGTEYLVNCKTRGMQQGTPPNILSSNIAGGLKYVAHYDGGFGAMNVTDTYFERVWSLGKFGTLVSNWKGCTISFESPLLDGIKPPPVFAEADYIDFSGSQIIYFDGLYTAGFPFNAYVTLNSSAIEGGPMFNTKQYEKDNIAYNNVKYRNIGGSSNLSSTLSRSDVPPQNMNGLPVIAGAKFTSQFYKVTYEAVGNKFDETVYETDRQLTVNANTHTATFTSENAARYQYGDMFTTTNQTIDWANDIYSGSGTTLGWVSAVNGSTVTLSYVPYGIVNGGFYNLYLTRIPAFIGRTFGDIAIGSTTISNVRYDAGATFGPGNKIKGKGIPAGAIVTAIAGSTITISLPATANSTNVELYDARVRATTTTDPIDINGSSIWPYDHQWFAGDRIYVTDGSAEDVRVVKTGGTQNHPTYPPGWIYIGEAPNDAVRKGASNTMTSAASINFPSNNSNIAMRVGLLTFQSYSNAYHMLSDNLNVLDAVNTTRVAEGAGSQLQWYNGGLKFSNVGTGAAGAAVTLTERWMIQPNGTWQIHSLAGTGTRLNLNTAAGEFISLANGTNGHILKLISGAPAWAASTDFYIENGTLTSTRQVSGAHNALTFGMIGSELSSFNVLTDTDIRLTGHIVEGTAFSTLDAPYTIPLNATNIDLNVDLTADRTLTLPDPSVQGAGSKLVIINRYNTSIYQWQFSRTVIDNATGDTVTETEGRKVYYMYADVSGQWRIILKY